MTNHEKARPLLARAQGKLEEAERWHQREDWNMTIRSCQEAVELALKGVLSGLGIDYPKQHDVGPAFRDAAPARLPPADTPSIDRIVRSSRWLDDRRTLSFYQEREYPREEADSALEQARFVIARVHDWSPLP